MGILSKLLDLLVGGSGVATAVSNVGKGVALAGFGIAAWHWLYEHRAEDAVSFTWLQLSLVGLLIFALIVVAHNARGPGQ